VQERIPELGEPHSWPREGNAATLKTDALPVPQSNNRMAELPGCLT